MTKPELFNSRDLSMSRWLRNILRDSATGLVLTDIDWILEDYKQNRMMLLEVKIGRDDLSWSQESIYNLADNCFIFGARQASVDYWGFYVLRMTGSDPDKSDKMTIQHGSKLRAITRDELIKHLNFEKRFIV